MIDDMKKDAEKRMEKTVEALRHEFTRMRTGRAHTGLLEPIKVEYYGHPTPLNQVANVAIEDARTLTVTPYEKDLVPKIEKAILQSDLGLTPVSAGEVIRVPLPALTEERRKDMIKLIKSEAENARVSIRNVRRDILNDVKQLRKEKELTEDDERAAQDEIQKVTDRFVKKVDDMMEEKEKDLMTF